MRLCRLAGPAATFPEAATRVLDQRSLPAAAAERAKAAAAPGGEPVHAAACFAAHPRGDLTLVGLRDGGVAAVRFDRGVALEAAGVVT